MRFAVFPGKEAQVAAGLVGSWTCVRRHAGELNLAPGHMALSILGSIWGLSSCSSCYSDHNSRLIILSKTFIYPVIRIAGAILEALWRLPGFRKDHHESKSRNTYC